MPAAWNFGGGSTYPRRCILPARGLGGKLAAAQAGVAGGIFGEVPGVGVESLRGLGPTAGRRSSAGAAGQGALLPRSEGRAVALGFSGG